MTNVGDLQTVVAKVPVAEMFGFASDIRSATAGKVLWSTESLGFEPIPGSSRPRSWPRSVSGAGSSPNRTTRRTTPAELLRQL